MSTSSLPRNFFPSLERIFVLSFNPFSNKPWSLWVYSSSPLQTLWGKEKFARNKQFLLFPQCFLPFQRTVHHFHQIQNCRLQTLSIWKSLKFVVWEKLNPFPNKPWFLHVCCTSILKKLWKTEKLLLMSNFSFSPSVFYLYGQLSAIYVKLEIVICNLFQFRKA